jgi:hypothetical protein
MIPLPFIQTQLLWISLCPYVVNQHMFALSFSHSLSFFLYVCLQRRRVRPGPAHLLIAHKALLQPCEVSRAKRLDHAVATSPHRNRIPVRKLVGAICHAIRPPDAVQQPKHTPVTSLMLVVASLKRHSYTCCCRRSRCSCRCMRSVLLRLYETSYVEFAIWTMFN